MKQTDYCPRAAEFDTYLTGSGLTGIEIGVDVGAHAEAMLRYRDIKHLTLVDIWDKEYYRGYCAGRLARFGSKITMVQAAAEKYIPASTYDFIYLDLPQQYNLTMNMLERWYPVLNQTGILGYRGARWPEVLKACREFKKDCIVLSDDIIMIK